MEIKSQVGWSQTVTPFIGEVKKRRASVQGAVALGPKWKDKCVVIIENEDGSVTVREVK